MLCRGLLFLLAILLSLALVYFEIASNSEVVSAGLQSHALWNSSLVDDVYWIHIQKTGTSFFNTIYLHFCPSILAEKPSLKQRNKPLSDTELVRDWPPERYCNVKFANMPRVGFHHPYPKQVGNGTLYHYFTMLRDPMERLRSAYSFFKLPSKNISFDTYVNDSKIPNCQLKMILGFGCYVRVKPSQLNVSLALKRVTSPRFFFGNTDRWDESICLFHRTYGGLTEPFELMNIRKTKRNHSSAFRTYMFAETVFYDKAMEIFDDRVRAARC